MVGFRKRARSLDDASFPFPNSQHNLAMKANLVLVCSVWRLVNAKQATMGGGGGVSSRQKKIRGKESFPSGPIARGRHFLMPGSGDVTFTFT